MNRRGRPRVSSPATLATVALSLALLAPACAPQYLASDFQSTYQPRTKVVAIAPIANRSGTKDAELAARSIREAIYMELAKQRDKYTVEVQDIAETDKRIRESGEADSAVAILPAPDICKLLGVDAVMKGAVTRYQKHGVGGQIAMAAITGLLTGSVSATGSDVKAEVAIYDGTDGKMIMQHDIEKSGGMFSSPDGLRKPVGSVVAAKFPYRKQKPK